MKPRIELLARPDHALDLYEGLRNRVNIHLHTFNVLERDSLLAKAFPHRKQISAGADVQLPFTLAKLGINALRKVSNFNWRKTERSLAEFFYGQIDLSESALVHYWPMYCHETVQRARERFGLKTLADVYEANPAFVNALVADEYERHGIALVTQNTQIDQNAFFAHERHVVVPSAFIRDSYADEFPQVNWHLAPYGFGGKSAKADCLRVKTTKKLRALYVGRVCLEKGVPYLCQAMTGLAAEVELDIIGPVQADHAPAFEPYKQQAGIRFLGGMTHGEVLSRLANYDVFVMPSLSDAYSLAVMEALMHGLPVIVTENTGCFAEIEKYGCGKVVPVRDSEALRNALVHYLKPAARAEAIHGIVSFDRAEAEQGYVRTMEALYDELLDVNQ